MLKIRIKVRRSGSNKPPQKTLPRSPGAKETQGMMREGGWRCPSICLPSHGMLSTQRRLANHCSRNAWQQRHTSQMLKIKGPNVVKSSNIFQHVVVVFCVLFKASIEHDAQINFDLNFLTSRRSHPPMVRIPTVTSPGCPETPPAPVYATVFREIIISLASSLTFAAITCDIAESADVDTT